MAFEGLTEKLTNAFNRLRGKGRLTEADVREAMREVKLALLEACLLYTSFLTPGIVFPRRNPEQSGILGPEISAPGIHSQITKISVGQRNAPPHRRQPSPDDQSILPPLQLGIEGSGNRQSWNLTVDVKHRLAFW